MVYSIGDRVLEVHPDSFQPYRTLDPGTIIDRDLLADRYKVLWDGEDDPDWIHGSLLTDAPLDWVPQSLFNFNTGKYEGVENE